MFSIPGLTIQEKLYDSPGTVVYRARREEDDCPVVLKILKEDFPHLAELTRYKREYEITHRLDLKHVIRSYHLEYIRNTPVIVFEDIGGVSLQQLAARRNLSLLERLEIAIALVEGVAEIHTAQIIHKDISPFNVVVNADTGELKIIDFGISSVLTRENPSLHNPEVLEGTLAYIAPEQTGRMNRAVDYRCDFYSLGATLYELFTGEPPFSGSDPLELVHRHLTQPPVPMDELDARIPSPLAAVVTKLLAKTAEERYQSAWGIKADLKRCLGEWSLYGRVEPFPLAQQDIPSQFHLPQKLYGREQEIAELLEVFERVSLGARQLMLVGGYSGIGKTCLVRELFKPLTKSRGYLISGKFDQFQRNIPYSALVNACQDLVRQLLTESESQLQHWCSELTAVLGRNGQVIVDVIPEVGLILGPQPAVPELPPREARNRFNLVFQAFIRVFYQPEHPLVIFLDDLQWADAATLKLLEVLVSEEGTRYLLLIGAYRDNEVGPDHPLTLVLNSLSKQGAPIGSIMLSPMTLVHTTQLVADTLYRDEESVLPLANLVQSKTGGNPFFVSQFLTTLYQEGLIHFDPGTSGNGRPCWQWDMGRIAEANFTDNVVDLMIGKLRRLPAPTVEVLCLAACLGDRFDLPTLAIISEQLTQQAYRHLFPAIQEGMVLPVSSLELLDARCADSPLVHFQCRFLHDRVQQAAYALIEEGARPLLHLKIGRLLLASTGEGRSVEKLFELVDHLNQGRGLVSSPEELIVLAGLNLDAARKARLAAAYDAARSYLQIAMSVFEGDWVRHYALTLALHRESAEAEYLNGNYDRAEWLINEVWERAQALDRAGAYAQLVTQRTMQGKNAEAIEAAAKALQLLGMGFPNEAELAGAVEKELADIERGLSGREVESLLELPEMEEPTIRGAMKVLMTVHTTVYFANHYLLYSWVLAKMTSLSIRYGNVPESAKGYASFGNTLAANLGRYRTGYEFGMLGLRLSEKYGDQSLKCKACLILSMFLNHWSRPLADSEVFDEEGQQAGMESGEFQFVGYILFYGRALRLFFHGENLVQLAPELDKYLAFTSKVKHHLSSDNLLGARKIVAVLSGEPSASLSFDGHGLDESAYLAQCHDNGSMAAVCFYLTVKAFTLYLLDEPTEALPCIEQAGELLGYVKGGLTQAEHCFYHSLILCALYPQADDPAALLAQLEANQRQMLVWAEHAPANFLHQHLLVQAEMGRLADRPVEAMELYDRAIEAAGSRGFMQYEALANELAAKFWLGRGKPDFAVRYLNRARLGYRAWGAKRKEVALQQAYPQLIAELAYPAQVTGISPMTPWQPGIGALHYSQYDPLTGYPPGSQLDLEAVLKASQAISGEIVLEKLLDRLLRVVIENAGAQRGSLVLRRDGEWQVVASISVSAPQAALFLDKPCMVEASSEVAAQIVQYVVRTQQGVVLHDAATEGMFTRDPYVLDRRPKSVLCQPIVQQGVLIGVLYLENNQVDGAFSPDRVALLGMLASQVAISLQNAMLYASLSTEITEHTRTEEELRLAEAKYRDIFDNATEGIFRTSADGQLLMANPSMARILGYDSPDQLVGHGQAGLVQHFVHGEEMEELLRVIRRHDAIRNFEFHGRRTDASVVELSLSAHAIRDVRGEVQFYEGMLQDISERKRLEAQLQHQATHDALTCLPNRNVLLDRLAQAIAHAKCHGEQCAVCFIDLDRFKWINDSFGHDVGDELLKIVAQRMSASLRESDMIARIGGDEFVLLLRGFGDAESVAHIVNRVADCLTEPLLLAGRYLTVTCSMGYSIYPADGQTAAELLRFADMAMFHAKERGRNNVQAYRPELSQRVNEKVRMEAELRHAIARNQLVLYYQPQVDLCSGDIVGVEALLRWQHPELGLVLPSRFIALAEETHLIEPIGEWVIRQSCLQGKAWQEAGLPAIPVSVNLSTVQLQGSGLEAMVAQCLADSGLDPHCLELELTESASMSDPEKNTALMHRLKAQGIGLAIDDFGTAYSNMYYLKNFPVDKLKLDGSFVREITSDVRSLAIVDAITVMAHRLGVKVIAEMAETEQQVVLLRAHDCDQVQGYYFSEPLPAEDCARLLRAGRVRLPEAEPFVDCQ
ncbi:EAL domain-containing protein [Pseudogulbenkiania ferrooxidans]|uniref:Diguanylate cyclase/phosphodiesterase with PAS/PAC and GAF sensor(S) n=1 Tax=Pseudogulbenkiania ferrooxidans 2002 TaxID=279714 RepID=B9Z8Q8_9NEIS|nr:EAL domain-containing protein [Pseudogulbenkiania ferrooxidans]EEG06841.1 diguanylate cyclase/phosphodiesterase with PAS/PAC and GAF sensor(s) [Pseudogulbenkiania ferrooxidans 2002]